MVLPCFGFVTSQITDIIASTFIILPHASMDITIACLGMLTRGAQRRSLGNTAGHFYTSP